MEQVHGVDVSWMTQASPKDKLFRKPSNNSAQPPPAQPKEAAKPSPATAPSPPTPVENKANGQTNGNAAAPPATNGATNSKRRSRSGSVEKPTGAQAPLHRRNSWFSNISAKFSGSSTANAAASNGALPANQTAQSAEPEDGDAKTPAPPTPAVNHPRNLSSGPRNAVLPPAAKPEGDGPYTPAPPKSSQAGFLGVFRRLSSSSAGNLGHGAKLGHGLVERRILNIDQNRSRCPISELNDSKMRRVSFCVDVEIAPMPKYADGEVQSKTPVNGSQKKKMTEAGEGAALKNPKAAEEAKESNGNVSPPLGTTPSEEDKLQKTESAKSTQTIDESTPIPPVPEKETTRKKEKKKKSEEERKARKEKKRKLAEANGSIPLELHYDSSDSSTESKVTLDGAPKTTSLPTTNPVRIYRRCCQLRESPILKKITEQLIDAPSTQTGVVDKLDLTGYFLQFEDLVTLGDYLAVVPVRELVLENCNIGDEGLRSVLAGLLAARRPGSKRRRPKHELQDQGGVVERLILKNNKIGPDGWKHIALFLYLCRTLKYLDVSNILLPRQGSKLQNSNGQPIPRGVIEILSKALGDRLGGSTLELVNLGGTEPTMDQLGLIMDGIIKSGVRRVGLANSQLDAQGVAHIARYLADGKCEALDLGGNDLRDLMEQLIAPVKENAPLWALSLADCNLKPASLCKIMPILTKLGNFRFIDLSHNQDLFQSTPSAVGLLRRYLPKMEPLKRIHLSDVAMTSEQAIALAEVLPEIRNLAHINLLDNAELVTLADAQTEEAQEEACALYASLLSATRLSTSLICVDIEVPGEQSGEIVKAMAKQVVAYCLRNMERIPDNDIGAAVSSALNEARRERDGSKSPSYPDVLVHLVGHDVMDRHEPITDDDSAPDEDYVIGGTGVVKALKCCLENRGDESRRQSGEFIREVEDGEVTQRPTLATGGKAKDMSKHLLAGARKIRMRLQPALTKARAHPSNEHDLRKLLFLDQTLQGIIKRFEDEYPDTRETADEDINSLIPPFKTIGKDASSPPPGEEEATGTMSDGEDDLSKIQPTRPLSRTNSVLSKKLAEEEARVHRAGHRFRSGMFTREQIDVLSTVDDIGSDPKHVPLLIGIADDLGGEVLERVKEKGVVRTFKEDRDLVFKCMREQDPDYWETFVESQRKARANITVSESEKPGIPQNAEESAIAD